MKKFVLLAAALAAFAAAPAMARDHSRINIGFYSPAPVYYQPVPVYYPSRLAYYQPPCHKKHYHRGHFARGHGHNNRNYARNDAPNWGRGHGHR